MIGPLSSWEVKVGKSLRQSKVSGDKEDLNSSISSEVGQHWESSGWQYVLAEAKPKAAKNSSNTVFISEAKILDWIKTYKSLLFLIRYRLTLKSCTCDLVACAF